MESSVYSTERVKSGIILDPRTKLLMMITITTLLLSTGNKGVMNIIKPVLSLVPFLLLLNEKQFKTAGKYFILYGLCFLIERIALFSIGGIISFILLAICSIMTRFAPGIMMGAFLLKSTSVSEFIASMEKIHIPEKIVIPLSVIFRFFPTIKQEYQAINDAMRMRGIRFGGKNPLLIVEYRLIPLIFSVIKIGDELSAAAITRGLGAPVKRTNVCKIGFHIQDILMMMICITCFIIFFMQN
jgi:energy-coupling factor transport system permease protein